MAIRSDSASLVFGAGMAFLNFSTEKSASIRATLGFTEVGGAHGASAFTVTN